MSAATKSDKRYRSSNGCEPRDNEPVSNFLVVPYFVDDQGRPGVERPLGPSVVPWICPSIVVNGKPGYNNFVRGEPTSVTVDVANWGAGTTSAPVHVQIWWADASTAFTGLNPFGQAVVIVPSGGVARRSAPVTYTVPTWASAHICLVVRLWSPLDTEAGQIANPAGDRHWAQLNLAEVVAPAGQDFQFAFQIGNPLAGVAAFDLAVSPIDDRRMAALERLRRHPLGDARTVDLELSVGRGRTAARGDMPLEILLGPGERSTAFVRGRLPHDLEKGAHIPFEIIQRSRDRTGGAFEGSLGLIVIVAPRQ